MCFSCGFVLRSDRFTQRNGLNSCKSNSGVLKRRTAAHTGSECPPCPALDSVEDLNRCGLISPDVSKEQHINPYVSEEKSAVDQSVRDGERLKNEASRSVVTLEPLHPNVDISALCRDVPLPNSELIIDTREGGGSIVDDGEVCAQGEKCVCVCV